MLKGALLGSQRGDISDQMGGRLSRSLAKERKGGSGTSRMVNNKREPFPRVKVNDFEGAGVPEAVGRTGNGVEGEEEWVVGEEEGDEDGRRFRRLVTSARESLICWISS